MLEFNPLYYKKEQCVKISFDCFLLQLYNRFFLFVSEVLYGISYSMKAVTHSLLLPNNTLPLNKNTVVPQLLDTVAVSYDANCNQLRTSYALTLCIFVIQVTKMMKTCEKGGYQPINYQYSHNDYNITCLLLHCLFLYPVHFTFLVCLAVLWIDFSAHCFQISGFLSAVGKVLIIIFVFLFKMTKIFVYNF